MKTLNYYIINTIYYNGKIQTYRSYNFEDIVDWFKKNARDDYRKGNLAFKLFENHLPVADVMVWEAFLID